MPKVFKVVLYLNRTYGLISEKDTIYVHLRKGVLHCTNGLGVSFA